MPTIPSSSALARKERWTLTEDALTLFLSVLDPDPNRAGERYEEIRKKLVSFFQRKRCGDAEHCADDTIDRAIRKQASSGIKAGLAVQQILDEPTAAAIAFSAFRRWRKSAVQGFWKVGMP